MMPVNSSRSLPSDATPGNLAQPSRRTTTRLIVTEFAVGTDWGKITMANKIVESIDDATVNFIEQNFDL